MIKAALSAKITVKMCLYTINTWPLSSSKKNKEITKGSFNVHKTRSEDAVRKCCYSNVSRKTVQAAGL